MIKPILRIGVVMAPLFGRKKEPKEIFDENMKKANELYNSPKRWSSKKRLLKHIETAQEITEIVTVGQEHLVRLWSMKGSVYWMGYHDLEKALYCYDKALSLNPKDFITLVNRVEVLYGMEKYDEIIRDCEKALELLPQESETKAISELPSLKPGHLTRMKGDQAASFERKQMNDRLAWSLVGKGIELNIQGKPEEAIKCFERALKIIPNYGEAWGRKGRAFSILGKFREAISCYDKALELEPEWVISWYNKGAALGKLSKSEEAIECYDRVVEINPRFYQAWVNKGIELKRLGKPEEAIECYDRALKINLRDPLGWYNKGVALDELGKFREAVKSYDKALKIYPKFAWAWYVKGMAMKRMDKHGEAEKCFLKAIEIDPRLKNKTKNFSM
jgi:tetratricopeptide (TPR) repeat protein